VEILPLPDLLPSISVVSGHFTRRTFVQLLTTVGLSVPARPLPAAAQSGLTMSYPIGTPGNVLGDGFIVRHGYATENTWYNPGWWHTGEDWYLVEGDTGGTGVYAAGAGEVVFAGFDYPGPVVIIAHDDDLYSMYGHLDYTLSVGAGDVVERSQHIGTVLARTDGIAPSHLHFEIRTFVTTPEVNGNAHRYDVGCGHECPPGPGYWPIDAPEHPSAMGWRAPVHVIGRHTPAGDGTEVVVAMTAPEAVDVWSSPTSDSGTGPLASLSLRPGDRYPLLGIDAGPEASDETSAEAYHLWYQIARPDGTKGWVQAVVPSSHDTGSDGRPSSLQFVLLPAEMPVVAG
jgi:murein DD-endopeptidase MepM/ murein hydrolase activator NlpD